MRLFIYSFECEKKFHDEPLREKELIKVRLTETCAGQQLDCFLRWGAVGVERLRDVFCEYHSDKSTGGRPDHEDRSPREKIGGDSAESFHQVRVLAARFRDGCAQLDIAQTAAHRQNAAAKPDDERQPDGRRFTQDPRGRNEDARADHRADYQADSVDHRDAFFQCQAFAIATFTIL